MSAAAGSLNVTDGALALTPGFPDVSEHAIFSSWLLGRFGDRHTEICTAQCHLHRTRDDRGRKLANDTSDGGRRDDEALGFDRHGARYRGLGGAAHTETRRSASRIGAPGRVRFFDALCGASAAVPVAIVTPWICAPAGIPTRMPPVGIPRSAPPEPNTGRDIDPDARSGSAPPIRSAPPRVSIGRRQSKFDAERQDESGEKQFHAGVNARPRRNIPSRGKKIR